MDPRKSLPDAFASAAKVVRAAPVRLGARAAVILIAGAVFDLPFLSLSAFATKRVQIHAGGLMEIIGAVTGAFFLTLPLALLGATARAALNREYFRLQEGEGAHAPEPARSSVFFPLLAVELVTGTAVLASAFIGALPGIVLLECGSRAVRPTLAWLGFRVAVLGALALFGYVMCGMACAARFAVFFALSPAEAVRRSWRLARGRRRRIALFLVAGYVVQAAGLVGLVALIIGAAVTLPLARAYGDVLLTRFFLETAAGPPPSRGTKRARRR